MNISIFGLGYVGTVSAACLAKHGHNVVGVDVNARKVESITCGESPIIEPGVGELLKDAVSKGRLHATIDADDAIARTDVSLICVGTPSNTNGSLNLDYMFAVAEQIGHALSEKKSYHAVVIRSTVLPGTVEKVGSVIEELSGKQIGIGFGVASNPEFLREGSSVADFENPPFTIVGGSDEHIVDMLRKVYSSVEASFFSVKIKEAELLKYACNSYHAVKVVFGNEIGSICKRLDIDSHVVMNIFCKDTKLNISPYYLIPGFAFGGSCLPKDVRAITYEARTLDTPVPLLDSLIPSNNVLIERVVDWILQKEKKRVGILGLSFKSNTDDLRESPIVKVVETLIGKGYSISIYDSNVNLSKLIGANKRFIEQEIPHISRLMKEHLQEVLDVSEVVVISNRSPEFKKAVMDPQSRYVVLDLVRIAADVKLSKGRYEGICW